MTNLDKYLDPPDEPEAALCGHCNQEMEVLPPLYSKTSFYKCTNSYCPSKHEGIAKEMAEKILDLDDTIHRLKLKIRRLEQK